MGNAEYNCPINDIEYDDLVDFNSFSGTSYIATKLNDKWGLIEIRDNNTPQCAWKVLAENNYNSLEELIKKWNLKTDI